MPYDTSVSLDRLLLDAPPARVVGGTSKAIPQIRAITSDSREISRHGVNALFVAVKGASFDGHDFVRAAYDAGCRVFAVSRDCPLPEDALRLVYPDTRVALACLSACLYGHPSRELRIVGVTGTKGKTTTCLLSEAILTGAGIPTGYIGTNGIRYADVSYESPNTTPDSPILQRVLREMVDAGVRVVLLEVSSQALMQSRVHGIEFSDVVFTNLSVDHIGGCEHPDFEHYKNTKRLLFTRCRSKRAILNCDDPHAPAFLPEDDRDVATFSICPPSTEDSPPLPPPALWAEDVSPSFSGGGRIGVSFTLRGSCVKDGSLPPFSRSPVSVTSGMR